MTLPADSNFPRTLAALAAGSVQGLHTGVQLYISLGGEARFDGAIGEARPGAPLRPSDLMIWLSASKPVAAVAVGRLWERGELDLEDPVALHLPEFSANGKERITIRHLLTHTAGIRLLQTGWPEQPFEGIVAKICAMKPEPRWVPGQKAGYHHASSWFVLGALVERLSGKPFSRYVREEIFEPLGMSDSWIGMAPESYAAARDAGRLAPTWNTDREGAPNHGFEEEEKVVACSPGGNGWGPARELGRFYEMLLGGGRRIGDPSGNEILRPQTVSALTARHRVGMFDHTFQHEMDWGLGFILDGKRHGPETVPYGYGRLCSYRTFGHSGYRSATAFADPEHALAVVLIPNGTPSAAAHEARTRAVLDAVYEDLGLGGA